MKKQNRIQVILDDSTLEKFEKEAKRQERSKSNLARKLIIEGLPKTDKEK